MRTSSFIRQKRIKWLKWRIKRNRAWLNCAEGAYSRARANGAWDYHRLRPFVQQVLHYENKILSCSAKIVYLTEKMSKRNDEE